MQTFKYFCIRSGYDMLGWRLYFVYFCNALLRQIWDSQK